MMTASVVSAGAASAGYYKAEGYYKSGTPEAEAATQWIGQAAEKFGLVGEIDDEKFAAVLDGETPSTGRMMGKYVDGERKHRPGLDLTFSAPKSVSIAALVLGDERVVEAHTNAVKAAIGHVESNLVQTRFFENGELKTETGGRIIAGMFRHDTSRALDPQLHTHVVVANMVLNSKGNFTALHNDKIFQDVKLGSQIYRSELAKNLQQLGYTPIRSGPHDLLEIKEVPETLIKEFSKRREQIAEALEQRGLPDNARTAHLAALATRANKDQEIDRTALKAEWQKTAAEHTERTPEAKSLVSKIKEGVRSINPKGMFRDDNKVQAQDASESVKTAIQHLGENSAIFSESALLSSSFRFSKSATLEDINNAVGKELESRNLRLTDSPVGDGSTFFTSKEQVAVERKIHAEIKSGENQNEFPLASQPRIQLGRRLHRSTLSEGQKEAVSLPFLSQDRFVAIQGYAGTGKTYMLDRLNQEAQKLGFKVEAVGPTHQSVKELNGVVENSETLKARLVRGGPSRQGLGEGETPDHSKTILAVDEASMISSKDMLQLLQQSNRLGVHKVVLVGDVQQLEAVSAGSPFAALQKTGIQTATMDDIQRQKNENSLEIVKHSIAGEVKAAFEKIGSNVVQAENIPETAAASYLAAGGTTAIATNTNRMRVAVNEAVREELKAGGALVGNDFQITGLDPRHFTTAELGDARSFQEGDVLVARADLKGTDIKKNAVLKVQSVNDEKNSLSLSYSDGSKTTLKLEPGSKQLDKLTVYTERQREFASGDRVKFRIIEESSPTSYGDTGVVSLASEKGIIVRLDTGENVDIDPNSLTAKGMDHGYALTLHDMQGATVDNVVIAMSANERLATQKSFYVAVSRVKDEATLVTDEPDRLADKIQRQTGERPNALDVLRQEELPKEPSISDTSDRASSKDLKPEPQLSADQEKENSDKDKDEQNTKTEKERGQSELSEHDTEARMGERDASPAPDSSDRINKLDEQAQSLGIERMRQQER